MLALKGVQGYYGESHILQGVTLDVGEGEIVTLIGRNGAGKTTTMRAIMGLCQVRGGAVTFGEHDLTRLPTYRIARLGISYVPEHRGIIGGLSVRENLRLAALASPEKRSGFERRLRQVLEYFPRLGERLSQEGTSLSGGEQQMLAIARALITAPRLMLVDEPTQGLAPAFVQTIMDILVRINRQDGVAVLLVEQNADMALRIAHRGYVIDQGVIQASGPAADILADREIQRRFLGA